MMKVIKLGLLFLLFCLQTKLNAFMPTIAFWQNARSPYVFLDDSGLGPSLSADTSMRSVWINSLGILNYKAVVINSGTCQSPGIAAVLAAATSTSSALPFMVSIPGGTVDDYFTVCAIGQDYSGVWQSEFEPTQSRTIRINTQKPTVTILALNGGSTFTTNQNTLVRLQSTSPTISITQFCLKSVMGAIAPTAPLESDSCWQNVNAPIPGLSPNTTIDFNNYYFGLGFAKGTYHLYAWTKTEAGAISNNSDTLNTDKFTMLYDPGTPPVINTIQVANTGVPSNPVTTAQKQVSNGNTIYVHWNASDVEGLAANPISVYYTSDDSNFTAFGGASDIANGINGACALDARFTGCVVLSAPISGYFRVRIVAKDNIGTTVFLNSEPMNEPSVKVLAGNTNDGLGGSATTAIFNVYGTGKNDSYLSKNRLVVSQDGKFFYIDSRRGLLWVDPSDGVLKKFVNITGSSSGEGVNISSATFTTASAITLDALNNLLVWDSNKIRKINLQTMIVTTVVGGGASTNPNGTVSASAIQLPSFHRTWGNFFTLPNGDIIFDAPATSTRHRRYRQADNMIELIEISGTGISGYPTEDLTSLTKVDFAVAYDATTSAISFMMKGYYKTFVGDGYPIYTRVDPASGNESTPYSIIGPYNLPFNAYNVVTGLDGKIYAVDRKRTNLYRYDYTTNVATRILGTGGLGFSPCADATLATSCVVDIDSLFVDRNGRIYFIDQGLVRTVNDSNQVITLFGQWPSFGNGGTAAIARFGSIQDIKFGKTAPIKDKILVLDSFGNQYRELVIDGNISKITDAGISWHGPWRFVTDPASGDIFSPSGSSLKKFDRTLGAWSGNLVGGGAYPYHDGTGEGRIGSEINLVSGYHAQIIGLINNKLFYQKYYWNSGVNYGCQVKTYDVTDSYRQGHFMGNANCGGSITTGVPFASIQISTTNMTNVEYFQDPVDSVFKYFTTNRGSNVIYAGTAAGNIYSYVTLAHAVNAFTYNFDGSGLNFFYCASNGNLYKYNRNSAVTTQLAWSSPTRKCHSDTSLLFNSDRNSLIFAYTENGLAGVAEFMNP